jgi:hypothetical protein
MMQNGVAAERQSPLAHEPRTASEAGEHARPAPLQPLGGTTTDASGVQVAPALAGGPLTSRLVAQRLMGTQPTTGVAGVHASLQSVSE